MKTIVVLIAMFLVVGIGTTYLVINRQAKSASGTIRVFAASGLRLAVEDAAKAFHKETGIIVQLEYGGSGDLETRLGVAKVGDVYLPADQSFITRTQQRGHVKESIALATQKPVLAVAPGNPLKIRSLADAQADGVRLGIPNPETASLGKVIQRRLGDQWPTFRQRLAVTKPTVNDVTTDLVGGALDAAIIWDANAHPFPNLVLIPLPEWGDSPETIAAGILSWSENPAAALAFARFMASPQHGTPLWTRHGYQPIPGGDTWALQPTVLLFAGAVNRPAFAPILKQFSEREGVRIDTTYNGCGILCAQMEAAMTSGTSRFPDGYLACDICFVEPVKEAFPTAIMISSTDILIAVAKGNPLGITGLADLARPGLRVGLGNAEQSTLGYMTSKMLESKGLTRAVAANARSNVPTGDLLLQHMLTGALDAAILYQANVAHNLKDLDTVAITGIPATAVQPYAVWKDSPYKGIMNRLLAATLANPESFRSAGFNWLSATQSVPSAELPVPDYLRKKSPPQFRQGGPNRPAVSATIPAVK